MGFETTKNKKKRKRRGVGESLMKTNNSQLKKQSFES
jgi:hypothetical protein